jgi:hypothetical protein
MPPSTMRWDSLAMNLQGTLMLPGAPHYERSRRVWNGMIDRRPPRLPCARIPRMLRQPCGSRLKPGSTSRCSAVVTASAVCR